ncbi:capsular polysaccharide biosynthesis protein [Granulosicoccaceae sp. 1_MG-2023]|nr:capsular polysaccharide biosynthesis protein [Granulosicoccaceae sp. 1_MG-2023]
MSYASYSRALVRDPLLPEVLGAPVVKAGVASAADARVSGFVGWGRKRSGLRAQDAARRSAKELVCLEDGFFGYWGHPASGDCVRLAYNVDRQGIYYDAHAPSDLESYLADGVEPDGPARVRVAAFCDQVREQRLSKYNHHRSTAMPASLRDKLAGADKICLVVDQTAGDQSIYFGLADDSVFRSMLRAALCENPGALIVVKTHPDVIAGKKASAIGNLDEFPEIVLVGEDVHPHALIEVVDRVYVVTSQIGFEALIYDKPVTCFGMPFYAGWGLTDDRVEVPARRGRLISKDKLIFDACFRYAVYIDPDSGRRCEPEVVLQWLALQRAYRSERISRLLAVDFSLWKRSWIGEFARVLADQVSHVNSAELSREDPQLPVLVWGAARAYELRKQYPGRRVLTMEDGFLRSAGLGTDLKRPSSVIIDDSGIYYDATRPSDLEKRIARVSVTEEQRRQARALIGRLVTSGATKYNLSSVDDDGIHAWVEARKASGRQVILVPGQVESDASLAYGSPAIRTNAALIRAVRADFPQAQIIYKPHPDVISRNRKGDTASEAGADITVENVSIASLYNLVDRVCVMTSLSGFEALLRGVKVSCYGLPFYSGWGLTDDRCASSRRSVQVDLESLVYHSMMAYPLYYDWHKKHFSSVFSVLDAVEAQAAGSARSVRAGGYLTKAGNFVEALLRRA